MSSKQKICVYAIYFPTSDKYYVGQTDNLQRRMICHLGNKSFVGNALRKYDDWTIEILHTCKSRDGVNVNILEIEEIRHYNCVAPNGYNLSRGGEGGANGCHWNLSEETKERMQGNQNAKGKNLGNQYAKGKHWKHTKEELEKMSKAQQGNQNAKGKNLGVDNVAHRIDVKYKKLKNRIKKLEQEIGDV